MLFLVALFALGHATTATTDDDVICDAPTPTWFTAELFIGDVMSDTTLAVLTPPADQVAELTAMEPVQNTFLGPYAMAYWNVDTDAHKAIHDPPMRHCEVHYKCFEWAGAAYDYTPRPKDHLTYGQTLGDNAFFSPMSMQALGCAYYFCAQNFYDVSDEAISYYELQFKYLLGQTANGKINTDLDFRAAGCHCNGKLEAAYPHQNDWETTIAKVSAGECINDLTNGGLQSGGWMWFCEKLSCLTALDTKFTDYITCTFDKYYGVDWEICPTNMIWLAQNYGMGYAGEFVTHLLTVFILVFVSFVPCVLAYGACRRTTKSDSSI